MPSAAGPSVGSVQDAAAVRRGGDDWGWLVGLAVAAAAVKASGRVKGDTRWQSGVWGGWGNVRVGR